MDVLFAKQDSLGLKSWSSYGHDAGIADTSSFVRCIADTTRVARIEAGIAAGNRLNVHGTPTVLVNGWRFPRAPDQELMLTSIAAIISGRQPFGSPEGKGVK